MRGGIKAAQAAYPNGSTPSYTQVCRDAVVLFVARVEIVLVGATDSSFNTAALAYCKAPASAGTFMIPSYVLLALPAGNFTSLELAPGTVQGAASAPFTATGLSIGFVQTYIDGASIGGFTLR